jgi:hypothetical protein
MTDLSQFSFEEQRRLLDLRPDGATAAVVLQSCLAGENFDVVGVEIREDEGLVVIETVFTGTINGETVSAPATLTAALSPLTRKELSYRMRLNTDDGDGGRGRMDIVAAEGWRSELYPIEEAI